LEAIFGSLSNEVAHLDTKMLLSEPGYFRTSFPNSTVFIDAGISIGDYEAISKPSEDMFKATHGNQPGDHKEGSKRIIKLLTGTGLVKDKEMLFERSW
ncbi:hypothetical protein WALSEDRAFT_22126, partial [Wallemia mellicola CBS 633.66]